jgi:hypothetical protein
VLAVEMLRAIVRGNESDGRIGRSLVKFNNHVCQSRINPRKIIGDAIEDLHRSLNPRHDPSSLCPHIDHIVQASLRVAAEGCCTDNAAEGRRSQRERELFAAIDGYNRWREGPKRR